MSDFHLALTQARYALLTSFRTPRTIVFAMAFPVVLLVMFNSIFTNGAADSVAFAGGTLNASAYFTASLSAYAIALSAFTSLAIGLTAQRETGQLKRLRGTPMPAWTFVAGQVMRAAVVAFLVVAALLATGVVFFGVHLEAERMLGFVLYVVLGTIVFSALGIAITAYTPTVDSASAVAPFVVVMLSFISGVFIAVDQLPNWLEAVGKAFPLYQVAEGLQTSLVSGTGGTGIVAHNVAVLALWGVAGVVAATRRFRWEP
jgi:ABC-2 type transport system permease protein